MASQVDFRRWATSLGDKSYYEILGVPNDATAEAIQTAFHAFALRCHPDQFVDEGPAVTQAAAEIFKRGVEAYEALTRDDLRTRYDAGLGRGRLRLDERRLSSHPPPPPSRTLETIARTARGKALALKAERLIAIGKLDDARVQLVSACQQEPDNEELADRLQMLYEALALEPF